jgi:hypothetical protein
VSFLDFVMIKLNSNAPNADKIQQEMLDLKEGMFSLGHRWATLEDFLASLLNAILHTDKPYGFALYFSAVSAETRFAIVDAAITQFFRGEPHEEQALGAWKELLKRMNTAKGNRNKVAHGTVQAPTVNGKLYARIAGPFFDLERRKPNEPNGMSLNDLRQAISLLSRAVAGTHYMNMLVTAARFKTHDGPALQQISRELAEHLRKESEEQFVPTIPIIPVQPPPS